MRCPLRKGNLQIFKGAFQEGSGQLELFPSVPLSLRDLFSKAR
jgi:hypothetical protein